ncbi:DUF1080 domain-containing protein [bacterium]|nr:DUF1080 domain-containing protein [bacterium]
MTKRSKPKYYVIAVLIVMVLSIGTVVTCFSPIRRPGGDSDPISQLMEEPSAEESIDLLHSNGLDGWYKVGMGNWSMQDGVLTVKNGIGYLATNYDRFKDFVLSVDVRTSKQANSGIFFRAEHPGLGFRPWPIGYEAQIDNHDPKNPTGSLYDRGTASASPPADGEWFSMQITAKGPHIRIQVNDALVVDATDTKFQQGFIALQAHDLGSVVEFRNMRLRHIGLSND